MKKIFPLLIVLVLLSAVFYACSGWALGWYWEPRFEKILSDLFGLRVEIQGFYLHPWPGKVRADRVTFHNPPDFRQEPHFDVQGLEGDLDVFALRDQHVLIHRLKFRQNVFYLERKLDQAAPSTNVTAWYRHMRSLIESRRVSEAPTLGLPRKRWQVDIETLQLENGSFVYVKYGKPNSEVKFVFQRLEGHIDGFRWPSEDPRKMGQVFTIRGTFGELYRAPFWLEGEANFATRDVSFDMKGEIRDGELAVYHSLWDGLPVRVAGGRFSLKTHVVCLLRELKAENEFVLSALQLNVGPKPQDKIWGFPLKVWVDFLQSQDILRLEIPVHGRLEDPSFEYHQAFRKAFQESLHQKTQAGLEPFKTSASRLAAGAQGVLEVPVKVLELPVRAVGELGKATASAVQGGPEEAQPS